MLGIKGDRPVVLFMSGGFGWNMEETFLNILQVQFPIELICCVGMNQALKQKLQIFPVIYYLFMQFFF